MSDEHNKENAMPDQRTKKRVARTHLDAIEAKCGPVYGVPLLDTMPLGKGGMLQQMATRDDLKHVARYNERVVSAYEVLTEHYREKCKEVENLRGLIANVIGGNWSVTELQESMGGAK